MTARDAVETANGILTDLSANVIGFADGTEPLTLEIEASGIRSLQIESASGYLYFDNIVFKVPEPSSLGLLSAGLAGLGFFGRRKQKA